MSSLNLNSDIYFPNKISSDQIKKIKKLSVKGYKWFLLWSASSCS